MKLLIIGAGGFGREVAWTASEAGFEVAGFCDDNPSAASRAGVAPFLGAVEAAAPAVADGCGFIVAVGDNAVRRELFRRAERCGLVPASVVSPAAVVAPSVSMGRGCYIGPRAVVSVGAAIGDGAIVNNLASIGHDSSIGDFAQVCPGAAVSGGCTVGAMALLGSNSTVIPGIAIGEGATLGAGAVALRDVAAGATIARLR